jgi:hypothetical protein
VVGLDDLRGGVQQGAEWPIVAGGIAEPDQGTDPQADPLGVDDGGVAGDHARFLQAPYPLGDGAGRHGHGPGQLGVAKGLRQ